MKEKNMSKTQRRSTRRSMFNSTWIADKLPYIFFLIMLAMIYIANAHWTEKKVRKINALKKEIRELNAHYMSLKSAVIYEATYSKLREQVAGAQLSNDGNFPERIGAQP